MWKKQEKKKNFNAHSSFIFFFFSSSSPHGIGSVCVFVFFIHEFREIDCFRVRRPFQELHKNLWVFPFSLEVYWVRSIQSNLWERKQNTLHIIVTTIELRPGGETFDFFHIHLLGCFDWIYINLSNPWIIIYCRICMLVTNSSIEAFTMNFVKLTLFFPLQIRVFFFFLLLSFSTRLKSIPLKVASFLQHVWQRILTSCSPTQVLRKSFSIERLL